MLGRNTRVFGHSNGSLGKHTKGNVAKLFAAFVECEAALFAACSKLDHRIAVRVVE